MKLYLIDVLIAEKAVAEDKKQSQVVKELAAFLGITTSGLKIIREKQATDRMRISPKILKVAEFFNCSMDEILNPLAKTQILQSEVDK